MRYFIQIHLGLFFWSQASLSLANQVTVVRGSCSLLKIEREGNPEPARGDLERNKGSHLGFCVKVRDLRGEGSVDSGSGHGLISPRESRDRGSPEGSLSGYPDNIPRTSEVSVLHCATC